MCVCGCGCACVVYKYMYVHECVSVCACVISDLLSSLYQDEVRRSRQLLQDKEQQLAKMVASLHVTAAQVITRTCTCTIMSSHLY